MDEYIGRYSERDVDGVTELCLAPFLAIRKVYRSIWLIAMPCAITSEQ
jgi:hypothetical protein